MKTETSLVQIALIVIAAVILFKVFQIDSNQKLIRDNINKSIKEIESAEKNLEAAQEEIANLEQTIKQFKIERELLETQKDSIVLNYREQLEGDRDELEKIKEDIKENTNELDRLRKLNDDFALKTEDSDEDKETKEIKEAIRQSHENLKKAIDAILERETQKK